MKDTAAVILAAGRGTRMKSEIPKVLHPILGKPMIEYVIDTAKEVGVGDIIVVAGFGKELLKDALKGTKVVIQKELLGSGDAMNAVRPALGRFGGDVLVMCGDAPLLERDTLKNLIKRHRASQASATVLTANVNNPTGYGRIVKDSRGFVAKIVEELEADITQKCISEINTGTYCFKAKELFGALDEIKPDNKKKEYFLTDAIAVLHKRGKRVEAVAVEDADTAIGINSRRDLAEATKILKEKILNSLMDSGVTIIDPSTTLISPDVRIARDTVIYPNTIIERGVDIGGYCRIGPFARIRSGVRLDDMVEIGNFVELVRTRVGSRTKIKHHAYLGDAAVGADVNIGAGTITANFDGKKKNKTIIEDGAAIGVGSILIAPVEVGAGSTVGAGCVVPKGRNIPRGATVVGVPARILKKVHS